ncbi:two-component system, OmpR family, sensor histidine kinase KdpD [Halopseudomonas xinjiangensis]|uniref:histidine kinase n=1 Tax=Halopseudomonas xinjiangensis TaxID=487184 RepID=A0A1H1LBA4_9GAMM|nr:ATP-binding protein [Halopseudomonas xinjiangensis]SDR71650.1 two-component system, OmpR family, sensor histidine kinase KdpD [Halopseudomonas xinjiangensis]
MPLSRSRGMAMLALPVVVPLLATAVSLMLAPLLPSADLAMIYLAGVLITSIYSRVWPALVCAILSFLAYNFFLTEPRYSLEMFHSEDMLTALLLVMVAAITGHLAARLNEKVAALRDSQRWSDQQMNCARALSACVDADAVIDVFAAQVAAAMDCKLQRSMTGDAPVPSNLDQGVGWRRDGQGCEVWFADLKRTPQGILRSKDYVLASRDEARLDALVSLARLAWSRVMLAESLRQETLVKEREQLRSALLSSISHDLRTPLATMIGSVSSLIDLADALSRKQRAELLDNTLSEARRLDRYIQKLLDMTRLGHGELTLDRDWVGVDDIVSVVLRRVRPLQGDVELKVALPADLPLLHVHPALIEQAVFNVLENAVRFSPPGGAVRIEASHDPDWLCLDITDSGPGIRPEAWEQVFDMFHTFSHGDQYAAGTGLGLAICRGILGAHRGSARVHRSEPNGGTTFRLSLPITRPDNQRDAAE